MLMYEHGKNIVGGTHINIDCGICHNPTYNFAARHFDPATNRWDWTGADATKQRVWDIASGVTPDLVTLACYNCHKTGFEAKRGTPFMPDAAGNADVHFTSGLNCIDCHVMEGTAAGITDIAGGHTDMKNGHGHRPGKSYPFTNRCTTCHGSGLSGDSGPSCYTCHGKKWRESMPNTGASPAQCKDCHPRIDHRWAKGDGHVDNAVNDRHGVENACTNCHDWSRHTDIDGGGSWTTSRHARVSCSICHTPVMNGANIFRRFRSTNPNDHYNVVKSGIKPFQSIAVQDAETGKSYTLMPFQWKWFNGQLTNPTDPDVYKRGKPVYTNRSNTTAKLVPVKQQRAIHYPGKDITGWFQMSHGTRPRTEALRNCSYCHSTLRTYIGL